MGKAMSKKKECGGGSLRKDGLTAKTTLWTRFIVLTVGAGGTLALIILTFYAFLLAPVLGSPMPPPWNSYMFFVVFEITLTLAFGAIFQGLLLVKRETALTI